MVHFISKISTSPKDVIKNGGPNKLLDKEELPHISFEELDYSELLKGTGEEIKDICCQLISDKKGKRIVCLDLKGITTIADYFIICTGEVDVHLKAIADAVIEGMGERGIKAWHIEGYNEQRWILIDLVDVVIHIFNKELRNTYELEKLWGDAKLTEMEDLP